MRTDSVLYCQGAQLQETYGVACHHDGTLRKLLRHHFKIHPLGFDAVDVYVHHRTLLGKVPSVAEGQLLTGMVDLVVVDRSQYRVCVQCEMGRTLLHRTRRVVYGRGPLEQVRRLENAKGGSRLRRSVLSLLC